MCVPSFTCSWRCTTRSGDLAQTNSPPLCRGCRTWPQACALSSGSNNSALDSDSVNVSPVLNWQESSVSPPASGTARRCICGPLDPYVIWETLFDHRWLCRAHSGRGYCSCCRRRAEKNKQLIIVVFFWMIEPSYQSNPVRSQGLKTLNQTCYVINVST